MLVVVEFKSKHPEGGGGGGIQELSELPKVGDTIGDGTMLAKVVEVETDGDYSQYDSGDQKVLAKVVAEF